MEWLLYLPLGTKVQVVFLLGEHGLYLLPLDSKFRSILAFPLESDLLPLHFSSLCSPLTWQVVLAVPYIPLVSHGEPRTMSQVHLSMFLFYYHRDTRAMSGLPALPQNQWSMSLCLWFSNFHNYLNISNPVFPHLPTSHTFGFMHWTSLPHPELPLSLGWKQWVSLPSCHILILSTQRIQWNSVI